MEWLVTGTITHRRWKKGPDGITRPQATQHFPSFVILDPSGVHSVERVRSLAWRMIGEPADFNIRVEERVTQPYDEENPVVDALMDLIVLYKNVEGHDPVFVEKAQTALRSARDEKRTPPPCEECIKRRQAYVPHPRPSTSLDEAATQEMKGRQTP